MRQDKGIYSRDVYKRQAAACIFRKIRHKNTSFYIVPDKNPGINLDFSIKSTIDVYKRQETVEFGSAYEKYFYLHYDKDGVFLYPEEKTTVTEREISLCGYFVIITS